MKEKRRFEESEYTKLVRVSEEDLEWLKRNKNKLTIAGFLKNIIQSAKKSK